MKQSRIHAVNHVNLEASEVAVDDLRWFYGDVVELEEVVCEESTQSQLCFKSEQIELRIRLVGQACPDPIPCRVTIEVSSLEEVFDMLQERSIAVERISGLATTDRRLQVIDPGGHRIELKQQWRPCLP